MPVGQLGRLWRTSYLRTQRDPGVRKLRDKNMHRLLYMGKLYRPGRLRDRYNAELRHVRNRDVHQLLYVG